MYRKNWIRRTAVETAAELRREPIRDTELGRVAIHMDQRDEEALYMRYPEMDPAVNDDADSRNRAWMKWIKSSASEPYRVRDKI